jgi:hypothetical protein
MHFKLYFLVSNITETIGFKAYKIINLMRKTYKY